MKLKYIINQDPSDVRHSIDDLVSFDSLDKERRNGNLIIDKLVRDEEYQKHMGRHIGIWQVKGFFWILKYFRLTSRIVIAITYAGPKYQDLFWYFDEYLNVYRCAYIDPYGKVVSLDKQIAEKMNTEGSFDSIDKVIRFCQKYSNEKKLLSDYALLLDKIDLATMLI